MPSFKIDLDQLASASGRYQDAASEAASARATLSGLAIDPSALGRTSSARALSSALTSFRDGHTQVAAGNENALVAFGQRLQALGGLASEASAQTDAAAKQA